MGLYFVAAMERRFWVAKVVLETLRVSEGTDFLVALEGQLLISEPLDLGVVVRDPLGGCDGLDLFLGALAASILHGDRLAFDNMDILLVDLRVAIDEAFEPRRFFGQCLHFGSIRELPALFSESSIVLRL